MAHYLVKAEPREGRLPELADKLAQQEFLHMQPFGRALTKGLNGARRLADGRVAWEEEDYCSPPLAMEREAVLDTYFHAIEVRKVREGEGWQQIDELPQLFAHAHTSENGHTPHRPAHNHAQNGHAPNH